MIIDCRRDGLRPSHLINITLHLFGFLTKQKQTVPAGMHLLCLTKKPTAKS